MIERKAIFLEGLKIPKRWAKERGFNVQRLEQYLNEIHKSAISILTEHPYLNPKTAVAIVTRDRGYDTTDSRRIWSIIAANNYVFAFPEQKGQSQIPLRQIAQWARAELEKGRDLKLVRPMVMETINAMRGNIGSEQEQQLWMHLMFEEDPVKFLETVNTLVIKLEGGERQAQLKFPGKNPSIMPTTSPKDLPPAPPHKEIVNPAKPKEQLTPQEQRQELIKRDIELLQSTLQKLSMDIYKITLTEKQLDDTVPFVLRAIARAVGETTTQRIKTLYEVE